MRLVAGRLFAAVAALCVSATVQSAQSPQSPTATSVPRVIRVTGTLQLATGPAAPVEIVTFAIYADETGGEPLWQETQNVTVDRDGQYATLLGSTLPDGVPLDLFVAKDARWFGMHVERQGEPEQRRVLLASVPYALRASDADTLGGRPASAFLLAPDATSGSGGTATTGKLTASTTAGQAAATGNAPGAPTVQDVVLPGAVNVLAKYLTSEDVGPSAVTEAGGRVGINTGAVPPADYLHIKFTDPFGAFTGLALQNMSNTASAASGMLFFDHNGVLTQFQGFNNSNHAYVINNIAKNGTNQFDGSYNFLIGSTSRLFVGSAGNIGIGTTAPAALFEVSNAPRPDHRHCQHCCYQLRRQLVRLGNLRAQHAGRSPRRRPCSMAMLAIWGGKATAPPVSPRSRGYFHARRGELDGRSAGHVHERFDNQFRDQSAPGPDDHDLQRQRGDWHRWTDGQPGGEQREQRFGARWDDLQHALHEWGQPSVRRPKGPRDGNRANGRAER